jgi:hypothetical protein
MRVFVSQPAGTNGQDCSFSEGQIGVALPSKGETLGSGLFIFVLKDGKGRTIDEMLVPIAAGYSTGLSYTPIDPSILKHAASILCSYRSTDTPRDARIGKSGCGNATAPAAVDQGYFANITSAEIVGTTVQIAYVADWSSFGSAVVGRFNGEKVFARVDGSTSTTELHGRAPQSGVIAVKLHGTVPREITLGDIDDGTFTTSRICLVR